MTFYLGFSRLRWILLDIDFFFIYIYIVTKVCHISNCTEYFLQVFNFAFPLTHSLFRYRPRHTSQGSKGRCFKSYSLCLVRDNGDKPHPCIFQVRDPYAPSKSHGSFCRESQFKKSDFSFVQHFRLPLDFFF